ncbi:HAD-IB family hydrolase [Streptomyces tateyamensis]|uniref:HAD-IB family hydrolase n=1 Tax=Streptomyces tateyamensis TaxID=565073 RepID=A0A2V4NW34_9ACTN|nr:HAD family hydrolase [Streptomyces tateyamensis]PYC72366.1 HAD-IB family hydrolase [Streptomyces tateyamensis]
MESSTAAFFDVDETLITVKSMFRFLRHYWRAVGRPEAEFDTAWQYFQQLPSQGVPRSEANRRFYAQFAGDRVAELARYGEQWFAAEQAEPGFWHPQGLPALRRHQQAGHLTVLVSGSFPPCLDPIARHLGVDAVLCSRPETAEGRYTGELLTPMIGAAKGQAARAFMAAHGLDPARCHAYGDHPSDLPLLEQVGHPTAVGSDPVLTAHADSHHWAHLAA